MSTLKQKTQKDRRIARVRAIVIGTADRPRLSVVRSLKHISAQLIDDGAGRTIAAVKDLDIAEKDRKGKTKTEIALQIGRLIAERGKAQGVDRAVFDRRDKRYHGRVKAVADGAREGGLIF